MSATVKGWEKPEGSNEWHAMTECGVSMCRHWMGYWPMADHDINDPANCQECVKYVRAGNVTLVNPFGPRPDEVKKRKKR